MARKVLFLGVALLALLACGDVGTVTAGGTGPGRTQIGADVEYEINVHNVGKVDVKELDLIFDGGDKLLDHNVITLVGSGCRVDKALPGFRCGGLQQGDMLAIGIHAQLKDAGNFDFKWHLADLGSDLNDKDGSPTVYGFKVTATP